MKHLLFISIFLITLTAEAAKKQPQPAQNFVCKTAIKDVMDETHILRRSSVALSLKPGETKEIAQLYNQPYYFTLGKGRIKPYLVTISRMESNGETRPLISNFLVKENIAVGKLYEVCAGKARVDDYCMLDSKTVATIQCGYAPKVKAPSVATE